MVQKGSHMNENNLIQNKDAKGIPNNPTLSVEAYLKACMQATEQTDFFARHGLHAKTVEKYCVGYDAERQLAVFPSSSELRHYFAQSISDEKLVTSSDAEETAEAIFNRKGLWASRKEPIFLVSHPLSALSVLQCGGNAVGVCGIEGIHQLIEALKWKKPTAPLSLSFDNDKEGRLLTARLVALLTKAKIPYVVSKVAGEERSPNALLMDDPQMLAKNILASKIEVEKTFKRGVGSVSACALQNAAIDSPVWIIPELLPQGLAVLCAASKVGKSWMAIQMCTKICVGESFLGHKANPCGCLYLALEDSLSRLQNRLNKVLKEKNAPENLYLATHAASMKGGLLQQLEEELEEHPDIKLVVVDTLQKIRDAAPRGELAYATDYREIGALKEFADRNKICILVIHHTRKMPDTDNVFNMISGSTGIMGVADTIFIIYKKMITDKSASLHMTGRDVIGGDLVIQFNEPECVWELVGSDKEEAEKRKQREYENNPIVQTIRSLCAIPPHSWSGTATEFLHCMKELTYTNANYSPATVGKAIKALEDDFLRYDHILHSEDRNSKEKVHTFKLERSQN